MEERETERVFRRMLFDPSKLCMLKRRDPSIYLSSLYTYSPFYLSFSHLRQITKKSVEEQSKPEL